MAEELHEKMGGMSIQHPNVLRVLHVSPASQDIVPRPDDVLVAAYPRSGTTWTIEIVRLIHLHHIPDNNRHVLNQDLYKRGIYVTEKKSRKCEDKINDADSPRIFKTHDYYTNLSYLPKTNAKIVFVIRNPKETYSSVHHHITSLKQTTLPMRDFILTALDRKKDEDGDKGSGNWWAFAREYLENRNQHNILYLSYERMKTRTAEAIQDVNKFLGYDKLGEEEVKLLVEQTSHDSMKQTHRPVANSRTGAGVNEKMGEHEERKADELTRVWLQENSDSIKNSGLDLASYYFNGLDSATC